MNSAELTVILLAGGEGKRMRSDIPKVLHLFNEKPMLVRIIETIQELRPKKIIVVTGKFHRQIIQTLSNYMDIFGIQFIRQPEPLGTGDAVKCCLEEFDNEDKVLILNGDMPLITLEILQDFIEKSRGVCNILSAKFSNPHGYGRIVYDKDGDFIGIIEQKDCTEEQKTIDIINTGLYYVNGNILKQFVPFITNNNVQNEYYLTDIVKIIISKSWNMIDTVLLDETKNKYISGVNTPEELAELQLL